MVLKVYCDVCGKEVDLFGSVPGVALDDPTVGQTISVNLNEMAYDEMELCKEHTEAFLKLLKEFQTSRREPTSGGKKE